jgi:hypothetical protein
MDRISLTAAIPLLAMRTCGRQWGTSNKGVLDVDLNLEEAQELVGSPW